MVCDIFLNIKKFKFIPALCGILSLICFGYAVYFFNMGNNFAYLLGKYIIPGIISLALCIHLRAVWKDASNQKIGKLIVIYTFLSSINSAIYYFFTTCFPPDILIFLGIAFVHMERMEQKIIPGSSLITTLFTISMFLIWIVLVALTVQLSCKSYTKMCEKLKIQKNLNYTFKTSLISSFVSVLLVCLTLVLILFLNDNLIVEKSNIIQACILIAHPIVFWIIFTRISKNSWKASLIPVWGVFFLEVLISIISSMLINI